MRQKTSFEKIVRHIVNFQIEKSEKKVYFHVVNFPIENKRKKWRTIFILKKRGRIFSYWRKMKKRKNIYLKVSSLPPLNFKFNSNFFLIIFTTSSINFIFNFVFYYAQQEVMRLENLFFIFSHFIFSNFKFSCFFLWQDGNVQYEHKCTMRQIDYERILWYFS